MVDKWREGRHADALVRRRHERLDIVGLMKGEDRLKKYWERGLDMIWNIFSLSWT